MSRMMQILGVMAVALMFGMGTPAQAQWGYYYPGGFAGYGYAPYGDLYTYYNMGAASPYGGYFGGYGPYPYYGSNLYNITSRGVAGPDEVEGPYTPLGLVDHYYGLPDPY